jgi:hypothetical protein
MNEIPAKQNSVDAHRLLRAREQTYREARVFQILQILATVGAPACLAVISISMPQWRAEAAAASLAMLLLDIAVFDRVQAKLLKRAAKIAEQFDCDVLSIRWNEFIADSRVEPEAIVRAADRYPDTEDAKKKITDWYPRSVGRAPLCVARIACQITNLWYDADLRKSYATAVTTLPFAVIAIAIAVALATKLTFEAVVLSILAPAAPIIVWALRERFRHRDTAIKQDEVRAVAETLWANVANCSEDECERRAREFQDAIYTRRVSSPLIFPLVYSLRRKRMEVEMNKGADIRLSEIGY